MGTDEILDESVHEMCTTGLEALAIDWVENVDVQPKWIDVQALSHHSFEGGGNTNSADVERCTNFHRFEPFDFEEWQGGDVHVSGFDSNCEQMDIEGISVRTNTLKSILKRIYIQQGGPELLQDLPSEGCQAFESLVARRAPKWINVRVEEIRFTHGRISEFFRHGSYEGESVYCLVQKLKDGLVVASQIPLLCVRAFGVLFSLFNRSLFALREFGAQTARPVYVSVLVLEADPITAKFVLSLTTNSEGNFVLVGK